MDDETLRELKKISKILLLSNAPLIEKELEKIASTTDRKKMWLLIDGIKTSKEIANQTGVSTRAVQYFLSAAQSAEFIGYSKTSVPFKFLDYVPPSWLELLEVREEPDKIISKDFHETTISKENS